MDNKLLVDNIAAICKEKDMPIYKLEQELGFSNGLIKRWENSSPSLEKVYDLAKYLDVSIDILVGLNQIKNKYNMLVEHIIDLTNARLLNWKPIKKESKSYQSICENENNLGLLDLAQVEIYHSKINNFLVYLYVEEWFDISYSLYVKDKTNSANEYIKIEEIAKGTLALLYKDVINNINSRMNELKKVKIVDDLIVEIQKIKEYNQ